MVSQIHQLLLDRASDMAAHDGAPMSAVYLVGAAGQLQAELTSARDTAVAQLRVPASPAPIIAAAPIAVVETLPVEPIVTPIVEPAPAPAPAANVAPAGPSEEAATDNAAPSAGNDPAAPTSPADEPAA